MARVKIGTNEYETTSRDGYPAIRKLNHKGGTARWVSLTSEVGRAVMESLDVEPAMAPGFNKPQ